MFELEANEKRYTGVITLHPELRQAVNETVGAVGTLLRSSTRRNFFKKKGKRKADSNNLNLFSKKKLLFKMMMSPAGVTDEVLLNAKLM